jgi:hypothetical protein
MPLGYPAAAAMRCHVTSPQLPRDVTDMLSQQLQQQAELLQVGLTGVAAAAAGGSTADRLDRRGSSSSRRKYCR